MKVRVTSLVRMRDIRRFRKSWRIANKIPLPSTVSVEQPIFINPTKVDPAPYVKRVSQIVSRLKQKDPSAGPATQMGFRFAFEGHKGHYRMSGEPYIDHPLSAAEIVSEEWGLDEVDVVAELLHDVPEDARIGGDRVTTDFLKEKLREIDKELAEEVAHVVEGLTEFGKEPGFKGEKPSESEIVSKILRYPRSIINKLADRLHNMRTLKHLPPKKQTEKSRDTLNVFVPLADRMGIWQVKRELEDLSYQYLNPENYEKIKTIRSEIAKESEKLVRDIIQSLRENLDESGIIEGIILEKRCVYELFERMQRRNISLENLNPSDIWRVNIIITKGKDCYNILGRVRKLYSPAKEEFDDDAIASPKANTHQFLHNYVEVPLFGRLLIQIRDEEMQENYRLGVLSKIKEAEYGWARVILRYLESKEALYESVAKVSDAIMIHTQPGKRLPFEKGSTALDFAHRINMTVFLHASKVEINGRPARLFQELKDGDSVYITTDPQNWPSLEWVDWVSSPRSLKTLRAYLEEQSQPKIIEAAIEFLNNETKRKYNLPIEGLVKTELFKAYMTRHEVKDDVDLYMKVGTGEIRVIKDKFLENFMKEYQGVFEAEAGGKKRMFRIMVFVEDRVGLLSDFATSLSELGVNFTDGFFFRDKKEGMLEEEDVKEGGEKKIKAAMVLNCAGISGLAGQIQQLQAASIINKIKGVEKVRIPEPKKIDKAIERLRENFEL